MWRSATSRPGWWRRGAVMQADGVGREAIRKAMVLLQSMFTVAIEWGEATTNPVSVVRKPRQGRDRAVKVISPRGVEDIRRRMLAWRPVGSDHRQRPGLLRRAPGRGAGVGAFPRAR
jgi:hypothetical protein